MYEDTCVRFIARFYGFLQHFYVLNFCSSHAMSLYLDDDGDGDAAAHADDGVSEIKLSGEVGEYQ